MTDTAVQALVDRVERAVARRIPLCIRGGGSKDYYGQPSSGELLDTGGLTGLSSYEPTELVVTARCGTPLTYLEAVLAGEGQCLPFEPPWFGLPGSALAERSATVGGMVAAGLAGPARAAAGSVRDYVLGATLLNGRAEVLSFGGQVIKNVAGYDVSRLLAGSMGVLGVILEVSLKVLPLPAATATLRFELGETEALDRLHDWSGQPLPLNASAWRGGLLSVRLSGAAAAVEAARRRLGGEHVAEVEAASFWAGLRHHDDPFFTDAFGAVDGRTALWRLSVPQTAAPLGLDGDTLIEWAGGQRWLTSALPSATVRRAASDVGGHATRFLSGDPCAEVAFAPLAPPIERIYRRLKESFDPHGIFNPDRLYLDL